MAYVALPTKGSGDILTLTNYDTIKNNFEASPIHQVTAKGQIPAASGSQAMGALAAGSNNAVLTADSSQSLGVLWATLYACYCHRTTNFDPTPGSFVAVPYDSDDYDPQSMHDHAGDDTAKSKIVVPTGGQGFYLVGATAEFAASGSAVDDEETGIQIQLWDDSAGAFTTIGQQKLETASDLASTYCLTTAIANIAAADYFRVLVYTDANVDVTASNFRSLAFWAIRVARLT